MPCLITRVEVQIGNFSINAAMKLFAATASFSLASIHSEHVRVTPTEHTCSGTISGAISSAFGVWLENIVAKEEHLANKPAFS